MFLLTDVNRRRPEEDPFRGAPKRQSNPACSDGCVLSLNRKYFCSSCCLPHNDELLVVDRNDGRWESPFWCLDRNNCHVLGFDQRDSDVSILVVSHSEEPEGSVDNEISSLYGLSLSHKSLNVVTSCCKRKHTYFRGAFLSSLKSYKFSCLFWLQFCYCKFNT